MFHLTLQVTFGYIVALLALSFVAILEVGLEIFSAGTSYFVILAAVATVSLGCTGKYLLCYSSWHFHCAFGSEILRNYLQFTCKGYKTVSQHLSVTSWAAQKYLLISEQNGLLQFGRNSHSRIHSNCTQFVSGHQKKWLLSPPCNNKNIQIAMFVDVLWPIGNPQTGWKWLTSCYTQCLAYRWTGGNYVLLG